MCLEKVGLYQWASRGKRDGIVATHKEKGKAFSLFQSFLKTRQRLAPNIDLLVFGFDYGENSFNTLLDSIISITLWNVMMKTFNSCTLIWCLRISFVQFLCYLIQLCNLSENSKTFQAIFH